MPNQTNLLAVGMGERIKKERLNIGYSQEKFSELFGISLQFLGDLERGRKMMSLANIIKFCDMFHLSFDYFITGKEYASSTDLLHENSDQSKDYQNLLSLSLIHI